MGMHRRANWTPVIISNSDLRIKGEKQVSPANDLVAGPAVSTLSYVTSADGSSEDTQKVLDHKTQRRADLRFAIGVVVALALPAVMGLGVYVAVESIILIAS